MATKKKKAAGLVRAVGTRLGSLVAGGAVSLVALSPAQTAQLELLIVAVVTFAADLLADRYFGGKA